MGQTLFELSEDAARLTEALLLVENSDLPEDEWQEAEANLQGLLEGLGNDLAKKVDGYGAVAAELQARYDALKAEADKLNAKAQAAKNARARLLDHLQEGLETLGVKKLQGQLYSATLSTSKRVEVLNEQALLEAGLGSIEMNVKIDKKAVRAALKAGDCPAGAAELREAHYVRLH